MFNFLNSKIISKGFKIVKKKDTINLIVNNEIIGCYNIKDEK